MVHFIDIIDKPPHLVQFSRFFINKNSDFKGLQVHFMHFVGIFG